MQIVRYHIQNNIIFISVICHLLLLLILISLNIIYINNSTKINANKSIINERSKQHTLTKHTQGQTASTLTSLATQASTAVRKLLQWPIHLPSTSTLIQATSLLTTKLQM